MNELTLKGQKEYVLRYDDSSFTIQASLDVKEEGLEFIHISLSAPEASVPPEIELSWTHVHDDIQGLWHPNAFVNRTIPCVWMGGLESHAAGSAPVATLFSSSGKNRHTYACSDAVNKISYRFVLREEDSLWLCSTKLFYSPIAPFTEYKADFRIDTRDVNFEDALGEVTKWWENMPEYAPMEAAEICRDPLYSTWYSFHQYVDGNEIEKVLESAAPFGFKSVIVDDGWQMEDSARTYAYCGDWEVCEKKISDMKSHVDKVHSLGMKYLLWYSVPYVGKYSLAYETFKGKYFGDGETVVLDPRYPDVREHLINKYENAVKEWGIDGFKLDFIDSFSQPEKESPNAAPGRDYISVPQAVDRLMTDIKNRLKAIKPEIAIEFRQSYIGPLMRKYGNMFRAADCANDTITNKVRTIDVRLTIGSSPVHSDMLTWNPKECPEGVALQLINVMFSVPQISVRPYNNSDEQNKALGFFINLWRENRDVLLSGKLRTYHPELLYPLVTAENSEKYIAGVYSASIVPAPENNPKVLIYANGGGENSIAARIKEKGMYRIKINDCMGNLLLDEEKEIECGIFESEVPRAGYLTITKI